MDVHIDFETRSELNLKDVGIERYARHPSTDIICMSWDMINSEPAIWIPGCQLPLWTTGAWMNHRIHAYNAQFERKIWRYVLARKYGATKDIPLRSWYCTAAQCAAYGLPRKLEAAAEVMGAGVKDAAGHKLMLKYTKPRAMEAGFPAGTVWWDDPDELEQIYEYCKRDVLIERRLFEKVPALTSRERSIYIMDQTMGNRGIGIDRPLVVRAERVALIATEKANEQITIATNGEVDKVTQVGRITEWLQDNQGVAVPDLTKATVAELLEDALPEDARTVLTARSEGGKTSMAKLKRFREWEVDGRLHCLLVHHGAHTGRWSARGAQPHNLPRGNVKNPEQYISTIMDYDSQDAYDLISLFENPAEVVSALLRPMFIAKPNNEFLVGDYSAIEAILTAWFAGQWDLLKRFASDEDVYEEEGKRVGATRQHGKAIILGCGFGMGWRKFIDAAKTMFGLIVSEAEAKAFIKHFRTTYNNIPKFWEQVELACRQAVLYPGNGYKVSTSNYEMLIEKRGKVLRIKLPSGRWLNYHNPRLDPNAFGSTDLIVDKQNSLTQQWEASKLYGGLITENIVQATARDVMAHGMMTLSLKGFPIVLTVHDEVIVETSKKTNYRLNQFTNILASRPPWAKGLPIKVKSFRTKRYKKD